MRKFLYPVGMALFLLTAPNTYASSQVYSESVGYTVQSDSKDLWLSRDGGKAFKVEKGDTFKYAGDYYLFDKETDTYQQFTIKNTESQFATTYEKLQEEIYQGLREHKSFFTIDIGNSISMSDVKSALESLNYKYPFVDYRYCIMTITGNQLSMDLTYIQDYEEHVETTEKIKKELDDLIASLDLTKPEYELEIELARWIMDKATYYRGGEPPTDSVTHLVQSLASSDELVCDGYARTFMYLLNNIGIETQLITGIASGGPHAWNLVRLDDSYYHVDLTWADEELQTSTDYINYFNELDSFMEETHTWNKELYPECNDTTYYNLNVFKFIDESLTDFTFDHSILTDYKKVRKTAKQIANNTGKPIKYYTYRKYDKAVMVMLDQLKEENE